MSNAWFLCGLNLLVRGWDKDQGDERDTRQVAEDPPIAMLALDKGWPWGGILTAPHP